MAGNRRSGCAGCRESRRRWASDHADAPSRVAAAALAACRTGPRPRASASVPRSGAAAVPRGLLEVIDHDLELAAGLVQAHPAAREDLRARRGPGSAPAGCAGGTSRSGPARGVLEREVQCPRPRPATGSRPRPRATPSPGPLEQQARVAIEPADGEDLGRGAGARSVQGSCMAVASLADPAFGRGVPPFPLAGPGGYNCALPFTCRVRPCCASRGSPHLRRRPAGACLLAGAAARGQPGHAAHARHPPQPADPLGAMDTVTSTGSPSPSRRRAASASSTRTCRSSSRRARSCG